MLLGLAVNVLFVFTFGGLWLASLSFGGLWLASLSSSEGDICHNWLKTFIHTCRPNFFKEEKNVQFFGIFGQTSPCNSISGKKHSKCIFSGCLLFWVSVCSYLWLCSRQKISVYSAFSQYNFIII